MKYLIQFSGGKDALASVFKVIEIAPKGASIDLFHLQLILYQDRLLSEQVARWIGQLECAYVQYKYLKETYKDYNFNFISPKYVSDSNSGYDVIYLQPISCTLAFYKNYDMLVRGVTKFNVDRAKVEHPDKGFPAVDENWDFYTKVHYKYIADIYFAFCDTFCLENAPIFYNPVINCTGKELLELIPSELHSYMWACEKPRIENYIVKHCNKEVCKKCKREEPGSVILDIPIVHTKSILDSYLNYRNEVEKFKSTM